jgi:hypothetical protein
MWIVLAKIFFYKAILKMLVFQSKGEKIPISEVGWRRDGKRAYFYTEDVAGRRYDMLWWLGNM